MPKCTQERPMPADVAGVRLLIWSHPDMAYTGPITKLFGCPHCGLTMKPIGVPFYAELADRLADPEEG